MYYNAPSSTKIPWTIHQLEDDKITLKQLYELLLRIITPNYDNTEQSFRRYLIHLRNNGIMEMDRPPACHFASVQDGKQEIYLEWPNLLLTCTLICIFRNFHVRKQAYTK